MRDALFKAAIVVAGVISQTPLPYLLIGLWNRVFGGWRSVFFCYGGNAEYLERYAPRALIAAFRWRPCPIGVLRQGDGWGLVLAAPMTEADFLDPANAAHFARFRRRIRRIARWLGVSQIHLAGILPSVLHRGGAEFPVHDTREGVAQCVEAAVAWLVETRFGGAWPPVILLGGAGYVGSRVTALLRAGDREVFVVDPADGFLELPDLGGAPALMLDISRARVLERYVDQLWPGMVVLNETFPEPPRRVQRAVAERGVDLYHLSGVAGRITPPLPFGYAGAVPCCARHDESAAPEVVVIQLAAAVR